MKIRVTLTDPRAARTFARALAVPYSVSGDTVDVELLPPFDDEIGAADVVHVGYGKERRLAPGVVTWQWLERPPSSTDALHKWMFGG